METQTVLIIDDDTAMCQFLAEILQQADLSAVWVTSGRAALDELKTHPIDTILSDLHLPDMSGIELCNALNALRPDIPSIIITAFGSMESAVEAMRAGAYDFITKPVDTDLLLLVVKRALKHRRMNEQIRLLQKPVQNTEFHHLLGESRPMQTLFGQIERIAETDVSVLITGETGTGKELVARALHENSLRKKGPFIALNCAAIPEALLESELFGHAQGAFTDARHDRLGLLLQAHGGTLFLDEIAELPIHLQSKLLRALETRRLRRLGDSREIPFDIRLISATNRDIEVEIEQGRFRSDLYYRIHVIGLTVPPLRERGMDILLLAHHFLQEITARHNKPVLALSKPAEEKLLSYSWPGNVRELRNAIEHAIALTITNQVILSDLPERIARFQPSQFTLVSSDNPGELLPLATVEQQYILHVLQSMGNNRTLSAKILAVDRKTLYRKLKEAKHG